MLILGISQAHDATVALVDNGRLVGAISNERLSRVKKMYGATQEMVDYVLQIAGKKQKDIDFIAVASFHPKVTNYANIWDNNTRKKVGPLLITAKGNTHQDYTVSLGDVNESIDLFLRPGMFIQHQLAHCASAYYTSPFKQAACFSVDSSLFAPDACSLYAYGDGNILHSFYCPGVMIGNAYYYFTDLLGLGNGLFKAGTLMGLSAYGKVHEIAKQKWQEYGESWYGRKFEDIDVNFINMMWAELSNRSPSNGFPSAEKDSQAAMDVAASMQYIFTKTMVHYANKLYDQTKGFNGNNICLSGGSFLNCDANTAIYKETPFQNVHLFPGCGDDGIAVGAALYAAHTIFNEPRHAYKSGEVCYLGRNYTTPDLGVSLDVNKVASIIASGKIVAWFQGKSEFGPRALGNRSLLADPRNKEMRDIINNRVKFREWFRPFAPSVLADHVSQWFDWHDASPYMLFTAQVLQPDKIPAVSHVDGTARMQTVDQDLNPSYHALITAFFNQTGVPLLLNTSLNNNEPLVETPDDAINFFRKADPIVELLVINDRMITKEDLENN